MPRRVTPPKKSAKKGGKRSGKKSGTNSGLLVAQPHGGAIRKGSLPGNTPGTGRPPDEIRAAMRELGATKGLPFLDGVLDGKVSVTLVGKCSECGEESKPTSTEWTKDLLGDVKASVDQRIKALEQALKYGLGTKDELTVVSEDVRRRLKVQVSVIHEMLPKEQADAVLARLDGVWS